MESFRKISSLLLFSDLIFTFHLVVIARIAQFVQQQNSAAYYDAISYSIPTIDNQLQQTVTRYRKLLIWLFYLADQRIISFPEL